MIPAFINLGSPAPWPVLPPGVHDATLGEIAAAFAITPHRQSLFQGFERAATNLRNAGCSTVYLNGSFVTANPHPKDFDGCWAVAGVDRSKIDPVLLDFIHPRKSQKLKYGGELFIAELPGAPGLSFLQLFQIEKYSGQAKGILRIQLGLKGPNP